jgi:hypothetical protein
MNNSADNNLMADLWVQKVSTTLLSPEDIKIEKSYVILYGCNCSSSMMRDSMMTSWYDCMSWNRSIWCF